MPSGLGFLVVRAKYEQVPPELFSPVRSGDDGLVPAHRVERPTIVGSVTDVRAHAPRRDPSVLRSRSGHGREASLARSSPPTERQHATLSPGNVSRAGDARARPDLSVRTISSFEGGARLTARHPEERRRATSTAVCHTGGRERSFPL